MPVSEHHRLVSESLRDWWERRKSAPFPIRPRSVPNPSPPDLMVQIIAAGIEWRDSRQPCLDAAGRPATTEEERIQRQAMWGRYSRAERTLHALFNKVGGSA